MCLEVIFTENFLKAPLAKQQSILNAGFESFGRDGYDKTAISEIAAKAGVSKASLFHYFGTKKELYLYLFHFACDAILDEMRPGTEDFFESLLIGIRSKIKVMSIHPGLYEFLLSLTREKNEELMGELTQVNSREIERGIAAMFENVDWNRFKPEYDKAMIMNLVNWVNDGCIRQFADSMTGSEIAAEEERYFKIIKNAIYKEEYL